MDNQNEGLPETFEALYRQIVYNDAGLDEVDKSFAKIRQVDDPAAHRALAKKLEEFILEYLDEITQAMRDEPLFLRVLEVLVRLENNPDKDLSDIFWNVVTAAKNSMSEKEVNDNCLAVGQRMALTLDYVSQFLGENMAPSLKQLKKELAAMTPAQYNSSSSAHLKAWVRAAGYSSPEKKPEPPSLDRNPFQREP